MIDPLVDLFLKMFIVFPLLLTVAISNLPSPSKSPIATAVALLPTVKSTAVANELDVMEPFVEVFRIIDTEPLKFGKTKSDFPSPSISAK